MAVVRVSTVAQLEGLLAAGDPCALLIVSAESVRSAAEMLRPLEVTYGVITLEAVGVIAPAPVLPEAVGDKDDGKEKIGGGSTKDADGNEASDDSDSDSNDDNGDEASDDSESMSISDDDGGNKDDGDEASDDEDGWEVMGVDQLRRAARLANLLIEMADDVIPALAATPGNVATLHRLRDLGKDVRRAGLLVPGNAGARAVTLGNKTQKLVSHAFNHRRSGFARSNVSRGNWIADRRMNLLDQVNGVLVTHVVLE